MKTSRIHELVQATPTDMALYPAKSSVTDFMVAHGNFLNFNLAQARMDPAFPWAFASAYAQAKLPLPAVVTEPVIQEAYEYLCFGTCSDTLRDALVLRQESMKLTRGLVEALLLVEPMLPLERISELTGLSVDAIETYEALFFSVRDRDQCYRATIAYPNTRQVEFQPDYLATVDYCDLLKRAAVRGGVDVVMELMGALKTGVQLSAKDYADIVKTNILAEALVLIEAGLIHQPLRIFDLAIKLIHATERAAARAPKVLTRVAAPVVAASRPPVFSVWQRLGAMLGRQSAKLSYKWHPSDQLQHASGASGTSGASDRLISKPRNPYFEVVVPSARGREMSWAFATPNRSAIATVTL